MLFVGDLRKLVAKLTTTVKRTSTVARARSQTAMRVCPFGCAVVNVTDATIGDSQLTWALDNIIYICVFDATTSECL